MLINLFCQLTRGFLVVNSGATRCLVRPLFDGPCKKRRTMRISSHCSVLSADNAINFCTVPSRILNVLLYRLLAVGNGESSLRPRLRDS